MCGCGAGAVRPGRPGGRQPRDGHIQGRGYPAQASRNEGKSAAGTAARAGGIAAAAGR